MSYTEQTSNSISGQITLELQAAHMYRGYSHHFNHPQVALKGFSQFFMDQATEELQHADSFITYHHMRGGKYSPDALVPVPSDHTLVQALDQALTLEKHVLSNLARIHECGDVQTQIFVEKYISHQTNSIAELEALQTKARRLSNVPGGTHLLDCELQRM